MVNAVGQPPVNQQKHNPMDCVMFALPSNIFISKRITFYDNFVARVTHGNTAPAFDAPVERTIAVFPYIKYSSPLRRYQ
jgi:hypothetical protein